MPRVTPLRPKGRPERRLLQALDKSRFPSRAAFYREVAATLGTEVEAEKSAFNRIIRGHTGDQTAWRIRTYAEILGAQPEDFLRAAERRSTARVSSQPIDVDDDRFEKLLGELEKLRLGQDGIRARLDLLEGRRPAQAPSQESLPGAG